MLFIFPLQRSQRTRRQTGVHSVQDVPHSEWSDLHLVNMWYFRILIFAEVLAPCWCPRLRLPRAPSVSWCGHLSRIWLKHWDNTTSPHSLYLTLHTALTIQGEHFNSRGHSIDNVTFTGLEQCMNKDPEYLHRREVHQIRRFDSKYHGLNRRF